MTVIGILLIVMAVFLVIAVLMQSSKDHRHGGVVAGGAETFFGKQKGKSMDALFNKLTTFVAIIFVILVVVLYVIQPSYIKLTIDANGNEAVENVVDEKVDISKGILISDYLNENNTEGLVGIALDAEGKELIDPSVEIYPTEDTTLYFIWEAPEAEEESAEATDEESAEGTTGEEVVVEETTEEVVVEEPAEEVVEEAPAVEETTEGGETVTE